jgi:alkaline phosphatase
MVVGLLVLAGCGAAMYAATGTRAREKTVTAQAGATATPVLRIGLVADVQYADREPEMGRHYRESLAKLREAVTRFQAARLDMLVELGDLVDAADTPQEELGYLKTVEAELAKFTGERHYVLGNHCVWSLTKKQLLANTAAKGEFYSFDKGNFHFVVLDGCYRPDGVAYGGKNSTWQESEIPPAERQWLAADLRATRKKTVVFVHQRLDAPPPYGIASAAEVRRIIEGSGKVLAVFQGHHHKGDLTKTGAVYYCTVAGMAEGAGETNSAYAILDVLADGTLVVTGFRRQESYVLLPGR